MMDRIASVKGADQKGYRIAISRLSRALPIGSIVVIEGVRSINRITKQSIKTRRQFVITTAGVPGDTFLSIYPAVEPVGRHQTVSRSPRNRAGILMVSAQTTHEVRQISACTFEIHYQA